MRRLTATAVAAALFLFLFSPQLRAQGYVCAEGGGSPTPNGWGAQVFGWMLQKGGFGDVVVLGVGGVDQGVETTFLALGASSVTQLAVTTSNADLPATYAAIRAADIVWMRGGNQANYVNFWNGTLTELAIQDVWAAGGVIGGTSAGCAVLGDWIYDSDVGSILSREAVRNPYHPFVTLTDDFLNLTPGTLLDTHFTERGRLGRLAVFIARAWKDAGVDLIGIGVDDRTALCVSPDGTAEVLGEGAVTFLHRSSETQAVIEPGAAPVYTDLVHHQLTEGYRYDLNARSVIAQSPNAIPVPAPTVAPAFQTTSLSGSDLADAARGDVQVLDGGDPSALFEGKLQVVDGTNELLGAVVSASPFASTTWDENRTGGPQYALALNPHFLALYLDTGVSVEARASGQILVQPPSVGAEAATLVLDSWGMTSTAFSTYVSTGGSIGPRQSVALEGARLHLIRTPMAYDALLHAPLTGTGAALYCSAKQSSQGCTPAIEAQGVASASLAQPFTIAASQIVDQVNGLLFYGHGSFESPFQGGFLCVAPPVKRTSGQNSGGAGACSGSFGFDFNGFVQSGFDATLVPGQVVYAQYWYRDPNSASTTGLSDACAFSIQQ